MCLRVDGCCAGRTISPEPIHSEHKKKTYKVFVFEINCGDITRKQT